MKFTISGSQYDIDRHLIIESVRGVAPREIDGRDKWYVQIEGKRFPIKQALGKAIDRESGDFNAGDALRVLKRCRFEVDRWENHPHRPGIGFGSKKARLKELSDVAPPASLKFAVTLEPDEDGFVVVSCPALPGCHTQGRTRDEALANITEAIRGYIASMRKHGEPIPSITEVQEVEVAA